MDQIKIDTKKRLNKNLALLIDEIFEISLEDWRLFGKNQPVLPTLIKATNESLKVVEDEVEDRLWMVFANRKGLTGSPVQDKAALGNVLKVTRERVRQMEMFVLSKVKEEVGLRISKDAVLESLSEFSIKLIAIERNGASDYRLTSHEEHDANAALDKRTRKYLRDHATDAAEILTLWSANELLSIQGFDEKNLAQVRAYLAVYGEILRDD